MQSSGRGKQRVKWWLCSCSPGSERGGEEREGNVFFLELWILHIQMVLVVMLIAVDLLLTVPYLPETLIWLLATSVAVKACQTAILWTNCSLACNNLDDGFFRSHLPRIHFFFSEGGDLSLPLCSDWCPVQHGNNNERCGKLRWKYVTKAQRKHNTRPAAGPTEPWDTSLWVG